ncbi:MAG TPA: Clp protease N-terminal domain-containing protein [Gemmataceae bacterium]|jgi:ATP-dependent Clp protease ATP-binding subunit ClpC|nr:Clp protease N-terminal domain-containing protein [Gemmataceae bacterium]
MYERFTDRARRVMQLANEEAQRFNHEYIGTEHILLGLVKEGDGVAAHVLKNLDIDLRKVRLEIEKIVQPGPEAVTTGKLPQTPKAKRVIEYAIAEARALSHNYVGTEHVLSGLLREGEGVAAQVLMNLGLKLEDVREEVLNLLGNTVDPVERLSLALENAPLKRTPALDSFGLDLTALARAGKLTPIIGRHNELERILMVLSCRAQNNPVLVGEPGVGKAAIVKGLAQLMADRDWPEVVQGRRLVAFNLIQMAALTRIAEFDEAIKAVINDVRRAKDVILFIDDLHTLIGAGTTSSGPGSGALRSALARGEIRCIAVATPQQYHSHIAGDAVLARHFQPIFVKPPTREETAEILLGVLAVYETHHGVRITDEALEAAIELTEQHLTDHCLPGKAIHALDEAGALVTLKKLPPPALKKLEAEIEQLAHLKEAAIAEQDFDKAAGLRDQADKLEKQRERTEQEWRERRQQAIGLVDRETVAEVVAKMAGESLEPF